MAQLNGKPNYARRDPISFDVTKEEASIIREIAQRSMGLGEARKHDRWTMQDICMDLTAVHANGTPLRLEELLAADAFNFAHDILGIRRNLDRETGALGNFFSPRFSRA